MASTRSLNNAHNLVNCINCDTYCQKHVYSNSKCYEHKHIVCGTVDRGYDTNSSGRRGHFLGRSVGSFQLHYKDVLS